MSETDYTPTEHQQELAQQYAYLQAEAAPILARMEEIKKTLRHELPYGTHKVAGVEIQIGHNRRLDAKMFAEYYSPDKFPELYKTVPDPAAIKRALPPAVIESLSPDGDPKVTFK